MRWSPPTRIAWGGLACALALCPAMIWGRRHDNPQELTARIARENNPVKKAKYEIRLGRLILEQAEQAYDGRHIPQGQELLARYTRDMQSAWNLLSATGRNAVKKPDGFMQLEIALRENNRDLRELRRRVYYLYRGPIDQTLKTLAQLHSKVLVDLFPGAVPPANPPGASEAFQSAKKRSRVEAARESHP